MMIQNATAQKLAAIASEHLMIYPSRISQWYKIHPHMVCKSTLDSDGYYVLEPLQPDDVFEGWLTYGFDDFVIGEGYEAVRKRFFLLTPPDFPTLYRYRPYPNSMDSDLQSKFMKDVGFKWMIEAWLERSACYDMFLEVMKEAGHDVKQCI